MAKRLTILTMIGGGLFVFAYCLAGRFGDNACSLNRVNSPQWGPVLADAQYPQRDAQSFRYVFDIPAQYINDHCLIRAGETWHLFFIQGDVAKSGEVWSRDGNEVKIGHAISQNLINWTPLEPALRTGRVGALDSGHVFAPFVIKHNGTYYMFYTGNVVGVGSSRIFLATSEDLCSWQRYGDGPIFSSDPNWAAYRPAGYLGGPAGPAGCRDPHIIRHPAHSFILYFAEWLKADPQRGNANVFGCIAAATSSDLIHWKDRGPVLIRKDSCHEEHSYCAPESPCVIFRNGLYYLFWKGGNGTRYTISRNPLDFRDREAYFLGTSHASEIFEWKDSWFVTSCSREIADVGHKNSDRSKGLFLAGLKWNGLWPHLSQLR